MPFALSGTWENELQRGPGNWPWSWSTFDGASGRSRQRGRAATTTGTALAQRSPSVSLPCPPDIEAAFRSALFQIEGQDGPGPGCALLQGDNRETRPQNLTKARYFPRILLILLFCCFSRSPLGNAGATSSHPPCTPSHPSATAQAQAQTWAVDTIRSIFLISSTFKEPTTG